MNLPNVWFVLVAVLLTGYAILDGFDLGTGVLYPFLARSEEEKRVVRASIGPVWDGNEVWLLTGAGAVFAAFPAVYAMSFSGFYLAIMLVLFGLILRAVSLEFRHRDEGLHGVWDACFFVGSLVPALLLGVAIGNVVRGVPLNATGDYTGSFWALLNPYALVVGVTGLAMFLAQGAAWLAVKSEGSLRDKVVRVRSLTHWALGVLILVITLYTGLAVHRHFDHNLGRFMGWVMIVLVVGGYLVARLAMDKGRDLPAFLASSVTIAGLFGLAAVGNFPDIVPARGSATSTSLTVRGAASGHLTLLVMLIVALIGVPLVLFYTALVYRWFRGKTKEEMAEY
jgi:cytochrome d ubiquinol oxidase subunit II